MPMRSLVLLKGEIQGPSIRSLEMAKLNCSDYSHSSCFALSYQRDAFYYLWMSTTASLPCFRAMYRKITSY